MAEGFRLKTAIHAAGLRMAANLRAKLVPHNGVQGVAREEVLREFLRANLPRRFEVATGFVFDAHGDVSRQLDVIIADMSFGSCFEEPGGARFYPCECVVAVGEVKTNCATGKGFADALDVLRSAAVLDRSADGQALAVQTGEKIDQQTDHLSRIFTFLLIINKSLSAKRARRALVDHIEPPNPRHLWPNLILALDRFLLTYRCYDGICPNTMHAQGVSLAQQDVGAIEVLLEFYIMLSRAVNATMIAAMNHGIYLERPTALRYDTIPFASDPERALMPREYYDGWEFDEPD